jgi:Protein of unknown function (DUF2778)
MAAACTRVTASNRFAPASRRGAMSRAVVIGGGTVTAAGLTTGAATVAAAWIASLALGGAPHLRVTPLALETAALNAPASRLIGTVVADLTPALRHAAGRAPFRPTPVNERGKSSKLQIASVAPPAPPAPSAEQAGSQAAAPSPDVFGAVDLFDPDPMSTGSLAAAPNAAPELPHDRFVAQVHDVPLPSPRPSYDAQSLPQRIIAAAPAKPELLHLASATPEVPAIDSLRQLLNPERKPAMALPGPDSHTALYDIEAHIVYMPDGTRLEAHSGLGARLDDVRYADERGRGPTPPNVYDLKLRDGMFHGVQAIRLNPEDEGKMFGRAGILAHPYMLGPTGQSFGCVSFKDYPEFLSAFEHGEVNRLVVVPHLEIQTSDGAHTRSARKASRG